MPVDPKRAAIVAGGVLASLLAACTCADPHPQGDDAGLDAGRDASGLDAGADADAATGPGPCDDPCPGSLSCCTGEAGAGCADLSSDPSNCGRCGAPCPVASPLCREGACAACETIGQTTCQGACVQLALDDANCGQCGHACGAGEQCIDGHCQGGVCASVCVDSVCCPGTDGRAECTDLRSDPQSCGACGTSCGAAGRCDGGAGRCVCDEVPDQVARCGDACVAIDRDEQNCGACGVVCPGDARICRQGRCVDCLSQGLLDCGGDDCTDPDTDERSCGGCGNACAVGTECLAGACVAGDCQVPCDGALDRGPVCCADPAGIAACTSLLVDPRHCGGCDQDCGEAGGCAAGVCDCADGGLARLCDGRCVDLASNPDHCGACGTRCPADAPRCLDEACTSCAHAGLSECGEAACTDTSSDPAHCGACDAPCAANEQCVQGACVRGDCALCDEDVGVCCQHPEARPRAGCADLASDFWNCGACGAWCADGQVCVAGRCSR